MCKCGKYPEASGGQAFGGQCGGVYEFHSGEECERVDSNTWRTRLFMPLVRFCERLAGPYKVTNAD